MPEPSPFKNKVPGKNYPTPAWGGAKVDGVPVVDEVLIETIDITDKNYVKLPEGAPHPDIENFPTHRLLKQEFVEYNIHRRYWCNGYRCQDQYNYDIAYSGESASHPIFQRRYLERRDQQSRLANGTKFSGIYLVQILLSGSGYDPENPPAITFTGGGGNGAAALSIVGSDGTLQWIYMTSEGSGYTSDPAVNISGAGGAIAVAKLNFDTGVVASITVTNGGTGYVGGATVNIGGSGSGAQAVAQVVGGVIKAVSVISNGSGYLVAPNITFSGILGSGATATSTIEIVSMQLVKEDVQELPEDDPRRSLYVVVVRTYESLPGPVLIEQKQIPFLNTYARVQKRIVAATQVVPDMFFKTVTPGQIEEYQPLSKWRSVQIISSLNSGIAWENGGADYVYYGTVNYTFPNEIHDDPIVDVVEAHETSGGSTTLVIDFGWILNVIEGYSGPCRAKFTRRLTFAPDDPTFQASLPTVTVINPRADMINERFAYSGGNLIARAIRFPIPSTLHPVLNVQVDTHGSTVVTALEPPLTVISATVPPGLPSGTEIVISVKPEAYDFGLYVFTIVSVFVP